MVGMAGGGEISGCRKVRCWVFPGFQVESGFTRDGGIIVRDNLPVNEGNNGRKYCWRRFP